MKWTSQDLALKISFNICHYNSFLKELYDAIIHTVRCIIIFKVLFFDAPNIRTHTLPLVSLKITARFWLASHIH